MYAVNFTEAIANGTKTGDPLWPKKTCSYGWEFNHSVIPYTTIATEVNFYPVSMMRAHNFFFN